MTDWEIIVHQASKMKEANIEWTSLGGRVKYKFVYVDDERVIINRLNGGEEATLGKKGVSNAIERLKQKGRLLRTELISSVVRQTTLVCLHPYIDWDATKKEVYWNNSRNYFNEVSSFIQEAKDDELNKVNILVNQRLNQSQFKKNLLKLYGGKCAISATSVQTVLEAAHIISHSSKGINSSDNGILLRSDLHRLFDSNLLLIHPKTLVVYLDDSLKNSSYWKFVGNTVAERVDGSKMNQQYLNEKWNRASWTNKLI